MRFAARWPQPGELKVVMTLSTAEGASKTMNDLSPTQAAAQIAKLLSASENRTLDFKRISGRHVRVLETICAFANCEGGLLAIGIADVKAMKAGAKPESRLFGIEENPEGFDDLF